MSILTPRRKKLAIKIFLIGIVVQTLLFCCFHTTQSPPVTVMQSSESVELRIRGQLHVPFQEGRSVILLKGNQSHGPVVLRASDGESVTVLVSPTIYRQHHRQLTLEEWTVIPYFPGMRLASQTPSKGALYEISY